MCALYACTEHNFVRDESCCESSEVCYSGSVGSISKYISYLLRHSTQDDSDFVALSSEGWADVSEVMERIHHNHSSEFSQEALRGLVATDSKGRFEFDSEEGRIRAVYGHSRDDVSIDENDGEAGLPDELYHGTTVERAASILQTGIQSRSRNTVHLSSDFESAVEVGARHGSDVAVVCVAPDESVTHRNELLYVTDFVPVGDILRVELQ